MFRHKGKSRTHIHNLRLASMLSFVAGIVNITGVLSVKVLTTNVTGHFAYFSEELYNKHYGIAFTFLVFILSFLSGAFVSNLLVELVLRKGGQRVHAAPMLIELLILITIALLADTHPLTDFNSKVIACSLLFAMGLQNALVTKISQSVVRTTHLTGLFTDLGIELSQLFFYRKTNEFKQLATNINLKLAIIGCFFIGCIAGGFVFKYLALKTLLLAAAGLVLAFFYDNIRLGYYHLKRKVLK